MGTLEHYTTVDPTKEWKRGLLGWLTRWSGIAMSAFVDVTASVLSFAFIHWSVGTIVLAAGVFLVCALWIVRYYRLQCLESDLSLHAFVHQSRDDAARVAVAESQTDYRNKLDIFHNGTAQRIANFFRERIGNKTINCAIRLAEIADGSEQYATVARSDGMDPSRARNSQPIPNDKGLALALRQQDKQGVFIIPAIGDIRNDPFWLGSKNDELPDVKALMVAPINGWEGESKVMLGILYVTCKTNVFAPGHTLPMKAFADFLGMVYPNIMAIYGDSDG